MSIRELQNSLRDGVILFRALLEELRRNMDEERQGIVMSYESLHDAIKQTYDSLLTSLDSQYNTTDRLAPFLFCRWCQGFGDHNNGMTMRPCQNLDKITRMLFSDSSDPSLTLWARCYQQ